MNLPSDVSAKTGLPTGEAGVAPMREGDIYFWRWSDAQLENRLKYNNGSYSLVYWCKSQITATPAPQVGNPAEASLRR